LTGCEKDKPLEYSSSLIGEWSWLISCGDWSCSTPASTNSTMKLVFTEDSLYFRYYNDTLQSSGRFYTRFVINYNIETINLIRMNTQENSFIIKRDTLYLTALKYIVSSEWKRIK
jgi:hypothetical protein